MRKQIFSIFIFIFFSQLNLQAQESFKIEPDLSEACNTAIHTQGHQVPKYPGGMSKLRKNLNKSIKFSESVHGEIYVSFVVNCKGKAYGFQLLKGFDSRVDLKFIELLKLQQEWIPGVYGDNNVDSMIALVFLFEEGGLSQIESLKAKVK